jgi:glucose-6-phosphate-specific signal transduction histidine kinase
MASNRAERPNSQYRRNRIATPATHGRANASQVTVSAKTHDHTLILSIDDDGIGGADSGKQGSGLIGLKDRVEVLGGRMHISSSPGSGTSLNVTIPLDSEETLDSAAPESSSRGDDVRGAGIRG